MFYRNQSLPTDYHRPQLREIHRDNRNLLLVDIVPDIEFRPVGKRKNADAFTLINSTIVETPQFGPLILGIPLAERVAERIHTLFRSGLFLIPPGSPEGRIEAALVEGVEQR